MSVTIELDENLIEKIDEISFGLEMNRKRFVEDALQEALQKLGKLSKLKKKKSEPLNLTENIQFSRMNFTLMKNS